MRERNVYRFTFKQLTVAGLVLVTLVVAVIGFLGGLKWGASVKTHRQIASKQVKPAALEYWTLNDDLPFAQMTVHVDSKTYERWNLEIKINAPFNAFTLDWKPVSCQSTREVAGDSTKEWKLSHSAVKMVFDPNTGVLNATIDAQMIVDALNDPGIYIDNVENMSGQIIGPDNKPVAVKTLVASRQPSQCAKAADALLYPFGPSQNSPGLDQAAVHFAQMQGVASSCLRQAIAPHPSPLAGAAAATSPLEQAIAKALFDWGNVFRDNQVKSVNVVWKTPFDPAYGDRLITGYVNQMQGQNKEWVFPPPSTLACTTSSSFVNTVVPAGVVTTAPQQAPPTSVAVVKSSDLLSQI
ncbi:MAG: hypothetical protein ACHQUB_00615 [Candidatus Saccharimonadia bacterium]